MPVTVVVVVVVVVVAVVPPVELAFSLSKGVVSNGSGLTSKKPPVSPSLATILKSSFASGAASTPAKLETMFLTKSYFTAA